MYAMHSEMRANYVAYRKCGISTKSTTSFTTNLDNYSIGVTRNVSNRRLASVQRMRHAT